MPDEVNEAQANLSDQDAASLAAVRLLREVVDYQRRIRALRMHAESGEQAYLIKAYRRSLELKRQLLDDLPKPPEPAPDDWR